MDAGLRQTFLNNRYAFSDTLPEEVVEIMNARQRFCLDVNYAYLIKELGLSALACAIGPPSYFSSWFRDWCPQEHPRINVRGLGFVNPKFLNNRCPRFGL